MTNKNEIPYNKSETDELLKKSRQLLSSTCKLVVYGPTKGGKSTFLRQITGMDGFFLSGVEKETSNFWTY